VCGHSVTTGETLAVCSAQVSGANAYEVSGSFTLLVMNRFCMPFFLSGFGVVVLFES